MNFIREIWILLNDTFEGNPVMLFISLGILYGIMSSFKAIPFLIKWKHGEIKKDREERNKAREELRKIHGTVDEICEEFKEQTIEMKHINGCIQEHQSNIDIHTPVNKLVTTELFKNETKHINNSIKAIFDKLDKA